MQCLKMLGLMAATNERFLKSLLVFQKVLAFTTIIPKINNKIMKLPIRLTCLVRLVIVEARPGSTLGTLYNELNLPTNQAIQAILANGPILSTIQKKQFEVEYIYFFFGQIKFRFLANLKKMIRYMIEKLIKVVNFINFVLKNVFENGVNQGFSEREIFLS